jgi:hypothetical protein
VAPIDARRRRIWEKAMKFAVVNGNRQEARPELSGQCPNCGSGLLAKCGDVRVWHWAHRGQRVCDHWWERETKWHRSWKDQFPEDWQEVVHRADDGEKHIADVKTEDGSVIEFQHSFLKREERRAREAFYGRMVWVVDGMRRKRDMPQFFEALSFAKVVRGKPLTFAIPNIEGALLRDWAESSAPVFFDFGDIKSPIDLPGFTTPVLWRLEPIGANGLRFLIPVLRSSFNAALPEGLNLKFFDFSRQFELARKMSRSQTRFQLPPTLPAIGFQRRMGRRARSRRRF